MGTKKTKKSFRKSAAFILTILASLGLGYITVKPVDSQWSRITANINDKSIIKDTEAYARRYIRDKYGFSPDKVECSYQVSSILFGKDIELSKKESLDLEAEFNGKQFSLSAYDFNDDSVPVFYDNYQEDNIKNSLDTYLKEIEPECNVIEFKLYSSSISESEEKLFMFGSDEKFDENESEQFIDNCSGYVELVVPEKSSSTKKLSEALSDHGIDCTLTNFDSTQNMYDFISKCSEKEQMPYSEYAPHITERITNNSSETQVISDYSALFDSGEFKYAYFANDDLLRNTSAVLKPLTSSDVLEKALSGTDDEQYLKNPLTKIYINDNYVVNNIFPRAVVYFPLENKSRSISIDKIALICCKIDSEDKPYILKAEKCGEYAVFDLPFGQNAFQIFSID